MLLANIFGFGNPVEIAIIAGVVVLLFGGAKIAGFGKSLGEGMKEFKKASRELHDGDADEPHSSAPLMAETPKTAVSDGTPHTAEATAATSAPTKE